MSEDLSKYRTANVPPPQLDAPDRTALRVDGPQSWTTTPPTVPGWYWVWSGYEVGACQFFEDNGQIVHAIDCDYYEPARHSGMAWLGPIAVPAPPPVNVPFVRLLDDTADLRNAIDRGEMLVITPDNAPAAVVAELRRMFDDPAWWAAFKREVESA